jgi:3-deoxy-manno-octulosonate cytidylyltransferase (CMP-KDO synthetase)
MSVIAIIPARYGSTRLPGKPLLARTGMTLIQHVVESVRCAHSVQRIVVATDDPRIFDAVSGFGGQAVMTSPDCRSGSDRLAQAAGLLGLADDDIVVNVQGDEPDMPPHCIDKLVEIIRTTSAPMATLATPITAKEAGNPNRVKVVLARDGKALYFSRSVIPYDRDGAQKIEGERGRWGDGEICPERSASSDSLSPPLPLSHSPSLVYLWHLGIYAYHTHFLKAFAAMAPTPAEQSEKLEQLRALENGFAIYVGVVDYDGVGIDTPEDYEAFVVREQLRHKGTKDTKKC